MSAAQSSPVFGRMKSAFQASSSPATATAMPTPQSGSSSTFTTQMDELSLLEEAIAEAEQQSPRLSDSIPAPIASPALAVTPDPVRPTTTIPPAIVPPAVTPPALDPIAQVVPTVIVAQTDTLNSTTVKTSPKEIWQTVPVVPETVSTEVIQPLETLAGPSIQETTTQNPVEAGAMASYVEVEPPSPEIPVEVEGYLQEVKDHQDQLPQEIVISADQVTLQPNSAPPLRPVVVLPITPEMENLGLHKNPAWSLRWLVEWSRKLMKMFAGKIIYRAEEAT